MKKKKKILTIIPSLYGGGAQKYVADLSFIFSNEFDHALVIYNNAENKYDYNGRVIEIDIPEKSNWIAKSIRQIKILKEIKEIKKNENPDITISHMLVSNMLNVLSRKNDKVICFLHGEWSIVTGKSKWLDKLVSLCYSKADMVISVSHYIANRFFENYNLLVPQKIVHVGIDISKIKDESNKDILVTLPSNYIIYVAGFRKVKNHLCLIKQLASYLKKGDYSLVLVGDGEMREEIMKLIKSLNLEDKVVLTGNLANPYPVLKKAKISIVVSSSESFSLVVVESMCLGVPVIATDCGGPREILIGRKLEQQLELPHQGVYGVLVTTPENWHATSLVEQIELLLNDEKRLLELSKNGKIRAEYFSLKRSENKLLEILNSLT